jgi:hypothetical protein
VLADGPLEATTVPASAVCGTIAKAAAPATRARASLLPTNIVQSSIASAQGCNKKLIELSALLRIFS